MEYTIKSIDRENYIEAFDLMWKSFLQYDAGYCDQQGIKAFEMDVIKNPLFVKMLEDDGNYMIGAYQEETLCGVMVVRKRSHIMLLYVRSTMLRQGVGRALIDSLKDKQSRITVNSSPFAVEFYEKLGFKIIDSSQNRHGIVSIPMIFDY